MTITPIGYYARFKILILKTLHVLRLRAARWAALVKTQKEVTSLSLFGSQVIGSTAVALFGRLADLVRPYLAARRITLSVSSQTAVYTLEQMFDMGTTGLIFSIALLLAPDRATLPHHDALQHTALGALAVTVALIIFAVSVRAWGGAIASRAEKNLGLLSTAVGHSARVRILAFRDGLHSIAKFGDLLRSFGLSFLLWCLMIAAYLEIPHAFVLSPELSSMTLARCMVLMAAGMVGSVVRLPVLAYLGGSPKLLSPQASCRIPSMCNSSLRLPAARCC